VPETKKLFSLFCTVFAIFKHLEAFGYYLFSQFCTVLPLKRQTDSENSKTSKCNGSIQMLPNASYFWNHLEVLLFSLSVCLFSVETVQNCENRQYPNASKCFQIAKTVLQNSENSFQKFLDLRHFVIALS